MLQFLYLADETRSNAQGAPAAGPSWPVRLLLGALLVLTGGLSGGAVYCWLWLALALPAAPTLPLLGPVGLALGINWLAVLGYQYQRPPVATAGLVASILASLLVIRLLLLCTFLFAFFF